MKQLNLPIHTQGRGYSIITDQINAAIDNRYSTCEMWFTACVFATLQCQPNHQ